MMSGKGYDAVASEGPANLTVTVRDHLGATKSQKMSIAFLAPADDTINDPRCADEASRGSTPPPPLLDPVLSSRDSAPSRVAEYENPESGPGAGAGPVDHKTVKPSHVEVSSESFTAKGKTALLPSRTAATGTSLHRPPTVTPCSVQSSGAALFIDPATSSREFIEEESRRDSSLSDNESIATGALTTSRTTRPPRPAYTEEQKFFIMYMRIILNKPWSAIEDAYTEMFGPDRTGGRSKGGLTSVYYRIRRNWGLEEVLQTSPNAMNGDRQMIEFRARNFSEDFLSSIGYPLGE
ncbi:hypothetical protein EJ03DRAFT_338641 [Teratosphaeria nubilosa]|uniref:Uncharacterized protein n=1 Tax=Teratosphaeria nubilosa TaxID=161662 RepID=A0A6G1KZI9_9PEZI|nr:hypothetical protein EJ03DRAFT_338641 [Teratosphaeria nubilosa]